MADPEDYFDLDNLNILFQQRALLIPFADVGETGLPKIIQDVLSHLLRILERVYRESQGIAPYDATWKAYQAELALEEIIFGRPLSPLDYQLSVSLGTSTVGDNSLSYHRGFIGLAPHNAASAGERLPPLHNWSRSELQIQRIERLFPLCQTLEAAPTIIGPALVTVLLQDIYRINIDIPFAALKSDHPPGKLIGAWALDTFCPTLLPGHGRSSPRLAKTSRCASWRDLSPQR